MFGHLSSVQGIPRDYARDDDARNESTTLHLSDNALKEFVLVLDQLKALEDSPFVLRETQFKRECGTLKELSIFATQKMIQAEQLDKNKLKEILPNDLIQEIQKPPVNLIRPV